MKKMVFGIACLLLIGCKDPQYYSGSTTLGLEERQVLINELVAKGSKTESEFGTTEDWIELYNNTDETLVLAAGAWYLSDSPSENPWKYELPEVTLAPREHLIVWCDNEDVVADYIHTNFKLNADGETVALLYRDGKKVKVIDSYTYTSFEPGSSLARVPDGSDYWQLADQPTPQLANE